MKRLSFPLAAALLLLAVVIVVGCSRSDGKEPEAGGIAVGIEVPESIRAGEPFRVQGTLTNRDKQSRKIDHGADLFTFEVADEQGKTVQVYNGEQIINMIGYNVTLNPGETYSFDSEEHVLPRLDELTLAAGRYEIVALAKYRVKNGGTGQTVEVRSEPVNVTVE
ncbi:BsuPI-related putative proteinase inhibitor [Paenibacillus methanolicus]|uniref:Intracellular proteinase inhibitor BsuPI domain-containing protein n=1 Tax=Paenibacillus methanolicus TaxID=582686 RepID=A0A5S5BQL0_9BACL|nr:BsuPI-related putative proteinase inhibitor [Paenibacillus methanolicus]TYP69495.1 hypothetical protein BCM02_11411 [Paenibacillus methanolicus]